MHTSTLNAAVRSGRGKGAARKLRATGRIPGTIYGGGADPLAVDLDPAQLRLLRREKLGWNTPLQVSLDGGDDVALAMLRDVQKHPLTGELIHADIIRVAGGATVDVSVRVDLTGKAAGVALGGRLNRPIRRVRLRCKPELIPESIVLDVTPLNIGDRVMIDELDLPEGVTAIYKERVPVVMLKGRRGGAVKVADEAEEAAEGAE